MRVSPLVAGLAGAVVLVACSPPQTGIEATSPPTSVAPITSAPTPAPSASTSNDPSASPAPTRYTDVRFKIIDDVADYSDDDDSCTPYRLRRGTLITLLDDQNRVVKSVKTGGGRELDDDGSCGTAISFGSFSSTSEVFTLKAGSLKVTYEAYELPQPELKSLPDHWTKNESGYLRWYENAYEDSEADQYAGWAIADGYATCDRILDYDNRRTQVETMIEDSDLSDEAAQEAARWLCPSATSIVEEAHRGFGDGTYDVGSDVKAGTYRTAKKTRNCYWSRTSNGGDILANDFVSYAPAGVTVTIRASDGGFESDGCSAWVRQ